MDFFNILRQGCTFKNTKHSKKLGFKNLEDLKPTNTSTSSSNNDPWAIPDQKKGEETKTHDTNVNNDLPPIKDLPQFRKKNRIVIQNGDDIDLMDDFRRIPLPEWMIDNLAKHKITTPTPIQMQTVPTIIKQRHVLGSAPTGSGKTLSFLIPTLLRLKCPKKKYFGRALVIDPTRELATQTLHEFERLTEGTKWRASLLDKVEPSDIAAGCDVLICTPSRLIYLLKEKIINLDNIRICILDEADKLFDLGFAPQVDEIMQGVKDKSQILLFSATMPPPVVELGESILVNPVQIRIGDQHAAASTVKQELIFVGTEDSKIQTLRQMRAEGKIKPPTLLFVQSKDRAQQLFRELIYDGIMADVITADRTKEERDGVIKGFRSGKIWVLICSDLMSRGVDFKGVNTVINFDLPQSARTYIHRVGRTGRAGRTGEAYTFFTDRDFDYLKPIVNVLKQSGSTVPDWMDKLKKPNRKMKKMAEYRPPRRKAISIPEEKKVIKKWKTRGGRKRNKNKGVVKEMKSENKNGEKENKETREDSSTQNSKKKKKGEKKVKKSVIKEKTDEKKKSKKKKKEKIVVE